MSEERKGEINLINTFLVTAALNEENMEAELDLEDPDEDEAFQKIVASTYDA